MTHFEVSFQILKISHVNCTKSSLKLGGGTTPNFVLYPPENMETHVKPRKKIILHFSLHANPPVHTLWKFGISAIFGPICPSFLELISPLLVNLQFWKLARLQYRLSRWELWKHFSNRSKNFWVKIFSKIEKFRKNSNFLKFFSRSVKDRNKVVATFCDD